MNKAMVFTYEEFQKLVREVSYDTMDVELDMCNEWFWYVREFSNELEYNAWLEEYGEEAEVEADDRYNDEEEFICRMIGRKFDAVVRTVVTDVINDVVAVIFE